MRGVVEEVEVVGGTIGCDMGDTIVAGTPWGIGIIEGDGATGTNVVLAEFE
jgi:hypothetical protein